MKFLAWNTFFLVAFALLVTCAPRYPVHFQHQAITLMDPNLVCGRLLNGFQYVLMKNQTPKNRVEIYLNVFAGSMYEKDHQQGVAHYLEHMLFNGSTHFKPGELVPYLHSIGIDFGQDANAYTSYFNTIYNLSLPNGNQKYLEKALMICDDYAQGALLLEEEIERERGIILAEKRERDSVSYRILEKTLAFELPGSLLNKRHPIGIERVIVNANRSLLKNFYNKWYRPDNMVLVAVGDFDTKALIKLIKYRFSNLEINSEFLPVPFFYRTLDPDVGWIPHKGSKVFYLFEPEAGDTEISIKQISYKPFKVQTMDQLKEELVVRLGYNILQNRLSYMIRNNTNGMSSASVYNGTYLRNINISAIEARTDPEEWKKGLEEIAVLIRQALLYGFKDSELLRVKADLIKALEAEAREAGNRQTKTIANQLLTALNKRSLFLSPQQEKNSLTPFINALALDQVNRAFKESWSQDHWLILVTGNAEIKALQDKTPEDEILEVFEKVEHRKIVPYKLFKSKIFPFLPTPLASREKIGEVKRLDNINDLGITRLEFQNGVKLNLKHTNFQKNQFDFKLIFGEGKQCEPVSKPGLTFICEATLQQSGFQSMDTDQLSEALAGHNVSMEFKVENEAFSLSGSADPNETALVFQLIYAFLKNTGFRTQALELAKIRYRQMFETLKWIPEGVMKIEGERFLANQDSRFGLSTPNEIDRLTLEDIRTWILPFIVHAPLELSIVGDFDPEVVERYARLYLGTLNSRTEVLSSGKEGIGFPSGKALNLSIKTQVNQGMVQLAFSTTTFSNIETMRGLNMLARVFSERLRETIREKFARSYSPYAYHNITSHIYNGIMHVVVMIQPGSSKEILEILWEIVRDLNSNGIKEDELEQIRKPMISNLKSIQQTNKYWLNSVLSGSYIYPEQLDWAVDMLKSYQSMNLDDLNRLAKCFLSPKQAATIVIEAVAD